MLPRFKVLGFRHSNKTKAKISVIQKGKNKSKEFIENLREARTGWKFSDETKEKLSEAAKRRGISKETREKMNAKIRSRAGRAKASASAIKRGKRGISEETRLKMSKASTGRILSKQHRKKLSEAAKKDWAKRKKQNAR